MEALERARRCALAASGGDGAPLLVPLPCWWDGAALWTLLGPEAAAALERSPECAVHVTAGAGDGALAAARARCFDRPVALAAHAPTVAAAMAALAAGRVPALARSAAEAAWRAPAALAGGRARGGLPGRRVPARLVLGAPESASAPAPPAGIAPALPGVVPAAVRRALAGRRQVLLASAEAGGGIALTPAAWSAGMALSAASPPDDGAAAVLVEAVDGRAALRLSGRLRDGRLEPAHATWWLDGREGAAAVGAGVELPD